MNPFSFWAAVRTTFSRSFTFLVSLPVLGLLIVGVEGLQHVVEWRNGMYASRAGLAAAQGDPHRLLVGSLKVVWLLAVQFWAMRFMVSGSGRIAVRPGRTAVLRFAVPLLAQTALSLLVIWLPAVLPANSRALGYAGFVQLAALPLGVALAPWLVGAALGDRRAGPFFALRRAWGSVWWGLGVTFAAILPAMAPHFALGLLAVGRPAGVAAAALMLDALLVGYLGVVVGAVNVPIAARMANRAGDRLRIDPP